MKIDRCFSPVTITLESQEEVDAMYAIIGRTGSGETGLAISEWYDALEPHISPEPLIVAEVLSYGIGLEVR